MSERWPQALDDAMKGMHLKHCFARASRGLSPREIFNYLPMMFPMTYQFTLNGHTLPIARYPVDQWEAQGEPVMTEAAWATWCMKVCENDLHNLEKVWQVASMMRPIPRGMPSEDNNDQTSQGAKGIGEGISLLAIAE